MSSKRSAGGSSSQETSAEDSKSSSLKKEEKLLAALKAKAVEEGLDASSPLPLTDALLKRFVISKKSLDKALPALKNYVEFLKSVDWSMSWEQIEPLYRLPFTQNPFPYPTALQSLSTVFRRSPRLLRWHFLPAKDGSTILINSTDGYEPGKLGSAKVLLVLFLFCESSQLTEAQWRGGLTLLLSVKKLSISNWSPGNERQTLHALFNCFPVRVKHAVLLHANMMLRIVWRIVKLWLSDKMRSRVVFIEAGSEKSQLGEGSYDNDKVVAHISGVWKNMQAQVALKSKAQSLPNKK